MSHDTSTTETTAQSLDVVYVTVVKLSGVRIVVPSTRLVVGVEVGVVFLIT